MSIYTNVPSFKTLYATSIQTFSAATASEEVAITEVATGVALGTGTVTLSPGLSCAKGTGSTGSPLMTCAFIGNISSVTSGSFEDVLCFWPICVSVRAQYTKLGAVVTTARTRYMKLGLYTDSDGKPATRLADSGSILCDSTGAKEYTIAIDMKPGWYWVALVADTGNPDHAWRGHAATGVTGVCGCDPSTASTSFYCGYYIAHTFSNSLPDPAGSVSPLAAVASPIVYVY
jgi:hypothetical protein